jgi:hypothetical protein
VGHGHSHAPVGDPEASAWLWQLVERLGRELPAGDSASAILQEAHETLTRFLRDENPRTRTQARALLLVGELVARGAPAEAADLLTGELRRSFPGHAELDPGELEQFGSDFQREP